MPDYHLYTIPIWDAYKKESECAFCELERMLEAQYLDAALGGGMMESDLRLATNAQGFCPKHLRDLYGMQAIHPLSLVLHTHLKDVAADLHEDMEQLTAAIAQEAGLPAIKKAARYLSQGGEVMGAADALADKAQARSQGCHICGKIEANMDRYVEALLYMWGEEKPFREAFAASKGLCVSHLPRVVRLAARKLSGEKRREFLSTLVALQQANMARLEQELRWFTLKFDYRNADKPWGESKDAVPRTMKKLRGTVLEDEPRGKA